ncbi:Glutaminase [Fusobacterium necrophorum subsp. necrophorum]|nr:Glutaminase [Fusobacterium necrophorum subsp. necrophorum]
MQDLLRKIVEKNKKLTDLGAVANYIPELDKADKNALGICVMDMEGNQFCYGECGTRFTIQSISKIISLMLAIWTMGKNMFFQK